MANQMVMTAPTQFNFSVNNIETMSLDTLRRTHKENDIYGQPVKGIYHYEVIQRMADLCEKHNLNYEVEEIFAAQNKNKNQPGVVVLPQVEREIDDIATYDHESVMELASDFVGDHIVPEDVDEEYGNSDEYVDLLDWWCEIFSYNIAELAMCHYFQTHKHLVDR